MSNMDVTNFNPLNVAVSSPRIYAQVPNTKPAYSQIKTSNSPYTDYFVSSTKTATGAQNPVMATIDDCLARVAPKVYLNKYINESVVEKALQTNPRIKEILSQNGLEAEYHMENVTGKNQEHFLTTWGAAKNLTSGLRGDDETCLIQASLLHDIGKAFIPPEILNKPGKLTAEEKEIVDLHSELGAEILKTTNLPSKVVENVRLHHTSASSPVKQNNLASQILSVADVYSALKEERPYKTKFSDEQVRDIMQNDPNLNQDIVNQIFFSEDLSREDFKTAG